MIYLQLFFEFFKVGLFAVGGGLATLPFLTDIAIKTGWYTTDELIDMVAISQSTPGPIGINMATSVGYKTGGILGGVIATLGLVVPAIIIIVIVAHYLNRFRQNKNVQSAFYGLRPASTALIAGAGISVVKLSLLTLDKYNLSGKIIDMINIKGVILAVILLFLTNKFNKHPVFYIAGAAIIGIVFKFSA